MTILVGEAILVNATMTHATGTRSIRGTSSSTNSTRLADTNASGARPVTASTPFADDLAKVWKNVARRASEDCNLVVRFGAINDRKVDPVELLRNSLRDSGWRITTTPPAGRPPRGRRQADHFGTTSDILDEYDVWARRS